MQPITDLLPGLIYVSDAEPGINRLRRGRGFSYRLPDGSPLRDDLHRSRIAALAIPPAYRDVWICIDERGHLQATGIDDRDRKQYRYHSEWQTFRSSMKFSQLASFGNCLPKIRRRIRRDMSSGVLDENAVMAAMVALLDTTHLRVGGRAYRDENRTYGATTLLKRHLKLDDGQIRLRFVAKGGKRADYELSNPLLHDVLEEISDLPGRDLFAWPDESGVTRSADSGRLNSYLAGICGGGVSAKTFRTWAGSLVAFNTALAAVRDGGRPKVKALCEAAADELHNTPAVCRSSHIHPAVLALTEDPSPLLGLASGQTGGAAANRGLKADEQRFQAFLLDQAVSEG